jgi:hypothetical protein
MSKTGFNNNFSYDPNVYGTIFTELETKKYNQPYQLRNANGKKAEMNFDKIMQKNKISFENGHQKKYAMHCMHFNGFGWIKDVKKFYTDRVLGDFRNNFWEIKNSITDAHHPSKIILESIATKLTHPNSKFLVYIDGKCMNTYKRYLENVPTIDMLVVGPVQLQNFINSNFTIPQKKLVIYNDFFKQQ